MDEPQGKYYDHDATNKGGDTSAPVATEVGDNERQELTNKHKNRGTPNNQPTTDYWARWQSHPLPEQLMAYFTFVIAICAGIQVCILNGSSSQTDKLITAANTQAGAATSISTSAGQFTTSSNEMKNKLVEAVTACFKNRFGLTSGTYV
jgi:hypothetical protein